MPSFCINSLVGVKKVCSLKSKVYFVTQQVYRQQSFWVMRMGGGGDSG